MVILKVLMFWENSSEKIQKLMEVLIMIKLNN